MMPGAGELHKLGLALTTRGLSCAAAESCTGGMVGAALTFLPGASRWFAGGIVAYDNRIKIELLGVDPALLRAHGAVSENVAAAMARGACSLFSVPAALAVTGIAGPGGGSPEKPVGLVYIACMLHGEVRAHAFRFSGSRETIRQAACAAATRLLLTRVSVF